MKKKILFICTGNTCRSPMAEGIFRDKIIRYGLSEQYQASSAGLYVMFEGGASPKSIRICGDNGVDITAHRAKQADAQLLYDNDLILTMTLAHKQEIIFRYPEIQNKVFSLHEFASAPIMSEKAKDISDPYGGNLDVYAKTFLEIDECIVKILQILIEITNQEEI